MPNYTEPQSDTIIAAETALEQVVGDLRIGAEMAQTELVCSMAMQTYRQTGGRSINSPAICEF